MEIRQRRKSTLLGACAVLMLSNQSFAGGPWVYTEGQGAVGTALVYEEFERAFVQGNQAIAETPGVNAHQENIWLWGQYGLTDQITLGGQIGYTTASHQASDFEYKGLADSRFNIQYQIANEWEGSPITIALQSALIARGTYESAGPGRPHAPGDLSNGFEFGAQVGKFIKQNLSIWADGGYRAMRQNVPDEVFHGIGASIYADDININFSWKSKRSKSGTDIGVPASGFDPNEFNLVKEERTWVEWGLGYSPTQLLNLQLSHAYVLTGSNTSDSEIYSLAIGFSI